MIIALATLAALAAAPASSLQDSSRLTISTAARRALAHHPAVGTARAARDRVAADRGEARAQLMPRVILDGSATRYQEAMLVYPLHGLPSAAAPATAAPAFDQTLFQAGAFVDWTVFDFGRRSATIRAAEHLEAAAEADLGSAELLLIQRTATAYLGVLTAREVLAAQDQRMTALTAEAARIAALLAEGKASRLQMLRVDAERTRAGADRIAASSRLEVAERELALLTGAPARAAALATVALRDSSAADTVRSRLLEIAREASPGIARARRRSESARAATGAWRAGRMPELRLRAGLVERASGANELRAEWQAGIGASWAIWSGGRRGNELRRAESDERGAAEQLRLADLTLGRELDLALAALAESRARAAALQTAVNHATEVAAIELTALEVGSGTQTDYLSALALLLNSRAGLIEARHAVISARIELARLAGDLSVTWLERMMEQSQ